MNKPLIMIGGGGHASVLADILLSQGSKILAVSSPEPICNYSMLSDIKRLGSDEEVMSFSIDEVKLVNGIGPRPGVYLRMEIAQKFEDKGYQFESVVSDAATVSKFSKLDKGVQILHGAIVQCGVELGLHSVVNTRSSVDHGCVIGAHSHIAPNATICGEVVVGENVYVGAGATVIQNLSIGADVIIGAAAIVTKDIKASCAIYPARSTLKGEA